VTHSLLCGNRCVETTKQTWDTERNQSAPPATAAHRRAFSSGVKDGPEAHVQGRGSQGHHPPAGGAMTHRPDDAGSTDFRNVGKLIPVYTALQPRRQPS
jgi:hypothetical protein